MHVIRAMLFPEKSPTKEHYPFNLNTFHYRIYKDFILEREKYLKAN